MENRSNKNMPDPNPEILEELHKLANYLKGLIKGDLNDPMTIMQLQDDFKGYAVEIVCGGYQRELLKPLATIFDRGVNEVKDKKLNHNANNNNENIFAQYYSQTKPHAKDKSIFRSTDPFEKVIQNAYKFEYVSEEGLLSGQARDHANTDATEVYTRHLTAAQLETDPVANLIKLRAAHSAVNNKLLHLADLLKKPDSLSDDTKKMHIAQEIGAAYLYLQKDLIPLLVTRFVLKPKQDQSIFQFSKPAMMSVADFQKRSSYSRLALRPKLLKEVDNALRACRVTTDGFFKDKKEVLVDKVQKYENLLNIVNQALEDKTIDKRRKEGLQELQTETQKMINYLNNQVPTIRAIYGEVALKNRLQMSQPKEVNTKFIKPK